MTTRSTPYMSREGGCSVEDCQSPVLARRFCNKHYTRWRKWGDPLVVKSDQSHRRIPPEDWPTERSCTKCGVVKSLEDFHHLRSGAFGHQAHCKECDIERVKAWQRKNADLNWSQHLVRCYGITADDYAEMLKQQGGVCQLCKKPETRHKAGVVFRLVVDHDHKTGRVRGLLCHRCNVAVGFLETHPGLLVRITEYLEEDSNARRSV